MLTSASAKREWHCTSLDWLVLGNIHTGALKIGRRLYNIVLAGAQPDTKIYAVKVATRYVREKIMVRHDPLRSPHTLF